MVRTTLILLGIVLAFSPAATAQESSRKGTPAEIRFSDGSLVRMIILQDYLEVMTRYGKLSVPMSEVRRVEFGLHVPGEVNEQISQSIKLLGSDLYKEREGAARELLQVGLWAAPSLQRASRSGDHEVATRAAHVLRQLSDKLPPETLRVKEDDIVHTAEFPVVGRIVSPTIKASSPHFGDLALKLPDLRTMHLRHQGGDAEFVLDASKHGSDVDQWFDSGIFVDPSLRLAVQSEGQIDLWPQGPGQYMASPKGFNTTGKGGVFMAGSLIGRIGENGKSFVVGDRYEGTPAEEGKLYLLIVPSPWNNASAGNFRVRVHTENNALVTAR